MDHNWWLIFSVGCHRVPDEADQRQGMQGDTKVWPGSVVILVDSVHSPQSSLVLTSLLLLDGGRGDQLQGEGSEGVEGEDILPDCGHIDVTIVASPCLRPVLVTLHLNTGAITILSTTPISGLTLPPSKRWVIMTMILTSCSNTILQNRFCVLCIGP